MFGLFELFGLIGLYRQGMPCLYGYIYDIINVGIGFGIVVCIYRIRYCIVIFLVFYLFSWNLSVTQFAGLLAI